MKSCFCECLLYVGLWKRCTSPYTNYFGETIMYLGVYLYFYLNSSEFWLEIDSKRLKIASKLPSNSKLGQFSAEIGTVRTRRLSQISLFVYFF